jgi:hypothetical protein
MQPGTHFGKGPGPGVALALVRMVHRRVEARNREGSGGGLKVIPERRTTTRVAWAEVVGVRVNESVLRWSGRYNFRECASQQCATARPLSKPIQSLVNDSPRNP